MVIGTIIVGTTAVGLVVHKYKKHRRKAKEDRGGFVNTDNYKNYTGNGNSDGYGNSSGYRNSDGYDNSNGYGSPGGYDSRTSRESSSWQDFPTPSHFQAPSQRSYNEPAVTYQNRTTQVTSYEPLSRGC